MLVIRKTLQHHQNYEINRCFPSFPDGGYVSRFKDILGLDNFSTRLEHIVELPPTNGTRALLNTTIAPLSSPSTGLVFTSKIQLISLSSFYTCSWGLTSFLSSWS